LNDKEGVNPIVTLSVIPSKQHLGAQQPHTLIEQDVALRPGGLSS